MKNFIDVTMAILIMGFVFWVITKMEVTWRGRSRLKSVSESVEKGKQVVSAGDEAMPFWKHKKMFLIGVVIILIAGWVYYDWEQNKTQDEVDELTCLQRIEYHPSASGAGFYRIDRDTFFKTQTEAMNYCLKFLKKHREE